MTRYWETWVVSLVYIISNLSYYFTYSNKELCSLVSPHHTIVCWTLVIMQFFDLWFLTDLHLFEREEAENHEIEVVSEYGSFHVNSTRPRNPPFGILTELGVNITLTLVRNSAKYFLPRPHSFVYRRVQNFKKFPLMTIFKPIFTLQCYIKKIILLNIKSVEA